jgi:glycosyltransferase involved in cell wall biosynthesis
MACGVGGYSRRLAGALAEAGHDVAFVTSEAIAAGTPFTEPDGLRVLPLLHDWDPTSFFRSLRAFRTPRPQLVLSNYPSQLPGRHARLLHLLPLLAKALWRRAHVAIVVHEFVRTEEAGKRWLRLAFRAADEIIPVDDPERDAIVARYPWAAKKIRVLPVGSNVPRVGASAEHLADTRRALAGERPLLFHFGLLSTPAKGFDDLLAALRGTDAVVAATGTLDDANDYHRQVAATLAERGLADRVRFVGYLDDNDASLLLQAADAVVLPFRRGAVGVNSSLLSALGNGAVVITTSGDETPDWLRDGDTALVSPAGDVDALAESIRRVLADPALAARVREGAERAARSFSWEQIAADVARPALG